MGKPHDGVSVTDKLITTLQNDKGDYLTIPQIEHKSGLKQSQIVRGLRDITALERYIISTRRTGGNNRIEAVKFVADREERKRSRLFNPAFWPIPGTIS